MLLGLTCPSAISGERIPKLKNVRGVRFDGNYGGLYLLSLTPTQMCRMTSPLCIRFCRGIYPNRNDRHISGPEYRKFAWPAATNHQVLQPHMCKKSVFHTRASLAALCVLDREGMTF